MKWPALYLIICIVSTKTFPLYAKRLLTIDELTGSPYSGSTFNGIWITDTQLEYLTDNSTMMTLDVVTKERTTFGDGDYLIPYTGVWDIVNIAIDQRWITIPHDCINVYIYSTMCNCSIIDLATRQEYLVAGGNYTQLVRFAPITNAVVYVQENDLYFLEKPDSPSPIRLTTTGKPGIVFNGVCDFAYEDNIYMKMRAFYFSTDGTKLVYLSLNDADLKVVHYSEYGLPGDPTVYQYVKDKTIRYPKVGTPIPKASVHVICLKTKKEIVIDELKAPIELQSEENIVVQFDWVDEKNVYVAWANRIQTIMVTMMCDVTTLKCQKILETKEPNGWIDYPTFYFKNSTFFAIVLPQPQGAGGNYRHLTVVSNGVQKALTSGLRVVDSIVDYDKNRSLIYYLATNLTHPQSLHFYVIPDDGSAPEKCISCNICGTVGASLSVNYSYYWITCKGPGLSADYVYCAKTGALVMELKNNTDVQTKLQEIILPDIYNFEMTLADGVSKGSVRLLTPPGLDINKKYPFILNVYGVPDSILNTEEYQTPDIFFYLATGLNVIVAQFDVRGSARRGDKYKFANYKKLGGVDVEDYIFLTKELMKKYSYIDSKRIGVYGLGYGGYIASMILARDTEKIFSCGFAHAPCSNFMFTVAFWTEAHMDLPDANKEGYNYTDITQLYDSFRGRDFKMVGDTAGLDTLYQHTAALARALQINNVPFQFQTLIDEGHPDQYWNSLGTSFFYNNAVVTFFSKSFNVRMAAKKDTNNGTNC